jgi:hypothetical protein
MGLPDPAGEIRSRTVLHLHHEALPANTQTSDIATVCAAMLHTAIHPVIVQSCRQVIGNLPLGAGARVLS